MKRTFYDFQDCYTPEDISTVELIHRIEGVMYDIVSQITGESEIILRGTKLSEKNTLVRGKRRRAGLEVQKHRKNPQQMSRYILLLDFIHQLLHDDEIVTIREAYYCLRQLFSNQGMLSKYITYILSMLECQRNCIHIIPNPRGEIAGDVFRVKHKYRISETEYDDGRRECIPIDDRFGSEFGRLVVDPNIQFILIVEKDSIFRRLVEDDFHLKSRSVVLTGKGFPDFKTREIVSEIMKRCPNIPVLVFTDWNPHGFHIYLNYAYGTITESIEGDPNNSSRDNSRRLGLNFEEIGNLFSDSNTKPLTPTDTTMLDNLLKNDLLDYSYEIKAQLNHMKRTRKKAEIEILYENGIEKFSEYVYNRIQEEISE